MRKKRVRKEEKEGKERGNKKDGTDFRQKSLESDSKRGIEAI